MSQQRTAVPDLGRIFEGETVSGLSEWQLLERYLERRDETAFEALVARHGPMVLGVCRRMLAGQAEIEDAFQATFLVLVRRARQLGPADAIGPWLYGVAARVALRARSDAARRRRLTATVALPAASASDGTSDDRELSQVVDQELARLPAKYRSPLVLCYLEGQTHEEAARRLHWPLGTVKGRLARARDLLRSRLTRRGMAPTALAVTLALTQDASATIAPELIDRTVKSSLKLALGQATAHVVSVSIASLVEGVLTSMFLNQLKWAGLAIVISGLTFTGAVALARQGNPLSPPKPKRSAAPPLRSAVDSVPEDGKNDPAVAAKSDAETAEAANAAATRSALHKEFLTAAQREWDALYEEYKHNHAILDRAYEASKRLLKAQEEESGASSDRTAAASHLDRIRQLARVEHANPSATDFQRAQVEAYAAEAQLWAAEAPSKPRDKLSKASDATSRDRGSKTLPGNDPQSLRVIAKLDEPLVMKFADETPLEEILKYIKLSTESPGLAKGIPIYVDPVGLSEADKTMNSTVRNMDLEGVPLRRTLQLALAQLDLIYFVEDGMMIITSKESGYEPLPPALTRPSPLRRKIDQAERGELNLKELQELAEELKAHDEIKRYRESDQPPPENLGGGGFGGDHSRNAQKPASTVDDSKRDRELLELLMKETRVLIDALNAAKAPQTPVKNPQGVP
jgi:RNA polymerase sigma factor (sigma-70 family)